MKTRVETDFLGRKPVPEDAYYGIQTARAVENFPVSGLRAPVVFVRAYVFVKKASAIANMQVGWLDRVIGKAVIEACDEILEGKLLDQFVVDVFQAGAGTSFNMNVNEVIANRALEILGKKKGEYGSVSPNDHINMGQSSNDTFPTALHLAVLLDLKQLLKELKMLSGAFVELSRKYADVIKSGRTHLNDALPLTVGQEFGAYAKALKKETDKIEERSRCLEELALGGTAVGTGVSAHPNFGKAAIAELCKMTGLKLRPAMDLFEALQSRSSVATVSGGLKELALELIRIANDLRLLASGPTAGLEEIELPTVQPGSSIMPGKVNPVLAECMDMIGFQVVGNDLAVSLAVQAGQLDLNVMTPVMMYNVLQSIELLTNFLPVFAEKCVRGIRVDKERCASYVERNPSLAIFLSRRVGYLKASHIAVQALKEKRSVKQLAIGRKLLAKDEAERVFSSESLLGKGRKNIR